MEVFQVKSEVSIPEFRFSVTSHPLVLDIPSIYISESILVTCKSRKFEELIISVGTIIGQIDS